MRAFDAGDFCESVKAIEDFHKKKNTGNQSRDQLDHNKAGEPLT